MPAMNADERESSAQRALQKAMRRSAALSNIATDAKGVIQIFNTGAERMLGFASSDVVNKLTPADLSDPDDVIARADALSAQLGIPVAPGFDALVYKASRGIEDQYDLTYVRKDQTRFRAAVSVTALRDASGTIIGYLLITSDLTSHPRADTNRGSRDRLPLEARPAARALLEARTDALMTIDASGVLTDVDRRTEALTGCTREEMIGTPFADYFTDPGRAAAGLARALREGAVTNYELTARAINGSLTVVSCNATAFGDPDRLHQGVFAAARDITELRGVELTLQRQNLELEDAVRVKDFLATMSHELRTPLNAIIGFSEVLRDGMLGTLTDEQQEFVGDIFGAGTHLLSLINDILDLSKVEAGKMQLYLESVPVATLLANCLTIIREKAALRRIHLGVEVSDALTSMPLDVRKAKQIVYNLLSNAVTFCSEGGSVLLRAERVSRLQVGQIGTTAPWPSRALPLAESPFREFAAISVTDTGIGVPADGLQHLFKSFSQLDGATRQRFRGTGLGLSLVKQFAELHGGTVGVTSAVGAGSCFTVWLPIRDVDADHAWSPTPTRLIAAPLQPGMRSAMIVAQDPARSGVMRERLIAEGFAVLHATSPDAGLALAAQHPLSLLALDLTMLSPADARTLLAQFTRLPNPRRTPLVIVSASTRGVPAALGVAALLQQPLSRQALCDVLIDIGLYPAPEGKALSALIAGADAAALDALAGHLLGVVTVAHRARTARAIVETARGMRPDVIVVERSTPFGEDLDWGAALDADVLTARIPILLSNPAASAGASPQAWSAMRAAAIRATPLDADRFSAAVRRVISGSRAAA
jgi:PAS domain S-box-containing protein